MENEQNLKNWKMSKAGTLENRFEEDLISQRLERKRIPFLIRRFSDTAYDGLYLPQKGWAVVMVPDAFVDKTKAIIADLRRDFKMKESEAEKQESEDRNQKSE